MKQAFRLVLLLVLGFVALQIYFAGRIALMRVLAPASTTFQRSEIWRLATQKHEVLWSQDWVDEPAQSRQLKRAVIASEDSTFVDHGGVDWEALDKAWKRNEKTEALAEKRQQQSRKPGAPPPKVHVFGGSTITQQLAKNLFLSGERNLLRKGQELVITLMLEAFLSKQRILEIYLNNVEWGEGVFGSQAAAQHYFRVDAKALSANQAAHLAVMLPAPKLYEKRPSSPFLLGRTGTVEARMGEVQIP